MQDSVLEQYFTALKEDANHKEERFDKQDELLQQIARTTAMILDMLASHESTVNYHTSSLSDHERRITTLERHAL